jgi:alanine-glyoxylate transaminase/(R)-3-amino-2-methylpropionate-pyruvate transaminase
VIIAAIEEIANAARTRVTNCTFGGNALAMSVGNAVLDYIEDHDIQGNCKKIGKIMMDGLHEIQDKYDVIGDVRGKGMMLGVEFVKDRDTKEPDTKALDVLHELMKQEGVIVGKGGLWGNTMRIKPPMVWTPEDAKFFLDVMDFSLAKMHK